MAVKECLQTGRISSLNNRYWLEPGAKLTNCAVADTTSIVSFETKILAGNTNQCIESVKVYHGVETFHLY